MSLYTIEREGDILRIDFGDESADNTLMQVYIVVVSHTNDPRVGDTLE